MKPKGQKPGGEAAEKNRSPLERGAPPDPPAPGLGGPTSRRRFLELIAAGSAAMLAGSVAPVRGATAPARPKAKATSAVSPAIKAEIESQKQQVLKALTVIREYPLATGSDMAFVFEPRKPARNAGRATRASRGGKPR